MASYSPVFSVPLIEYTPGSPNTAFEVPAGFTSIVRQVTCIQDIGDYFINVAVQEDATADRLVFWQVNGVAALQWVAWEGRVVCNEGGFVTISASSIGMKPSIYVGGYLLRNSLT